MEKPVNVIFLILQMFLLICQTYLISTISEPGAYSQERRNFRTSAPPLSFLMTQKVSSSRRMFSPSAPTLLCWDGHISPTTLVPWLPSSVVTHHRHTEVRPGCNRKLKIDMGRGTELSQALERDLRKSLATEGSQSPESF